MSSLSVCFIAVAQTPPVQTVGPHVATLGMKFYTGSTISLYFLAVYTLSLI